MSASPERSSKAHGAGDAVSLPDLQIRRFASYLREHDARPLINGKNILIFLRLSGFHIVCVAVREVRVLIEKINRCKAW
jgi:hypothetical protein